MLDWVLIWCSNILLFSLDMRCSVWWTLGLVALTEGNLLGTPALSVDHAGERSEGTEQLEQSCLCSYHKCPTDTAVRSVWWAIGQVSWLWHCSNLDFPSCFWAWELWKGFISIKVTVYIFLYFFFFIGKRTGCQPKRKSIWFLSWSGESCVKRNWYDFFLWVGEVDNV